MAKVSGPLFSMAVSGSFGGIIFDRRGYAYVRHRSRDAQTPGQGNFRLAMTVAQKCASACGPTTRQQVKELTPEPARWSPYLVKQLIGPKSQSFLDGLAQYADPGVEQAGWEAAGGRIPLREVFIPYAQHGPVTPGAQLFLLASTLFRLGLYPNLDWPDGNPQLWQESISS